MSSRGTATILPALRKPAAAVLVAVVTAGCAGQAPAGPATAAAAAPQNPPATAQQLGSHTQGPMSAWAVVRSLDARGLPVPHPLDVTAQACHTPACLQSVITDTVQVTSFSNAADARSYAGRRGLSAVSDVVVAFAPVLTPSERDQLWSAVSQVVR